jgi:hypothetical protein
MNLLRQISWQEALTRLEVRRYSNPVIESKASLIECLEALSRAPSQWCRSLAFLNTYCGELVLKLVNSKGSLDPSRNPYRLTASSPLVEPEPSLSRHDAGFSSAEGSEEHFSVAAGTDEAEAAVEDGTERAIPDEVFLTQLADFQARALVDGGLYRLAELICRSNSIFLLPHRDKTSAERPDDHPVDWEGVEVDSGVQMDSSQQKTSEEKSRIRYSAALHRLPSGRSLTRELLWRLCELDRGETATARKRWQREMHRLGSRRTTAGHPLPSFPSLLSDLYLQMGSRMIELLLQKGQWGEALSVLREAELVPHLWNSPTFRRLPYAVAALRNGEQHLPAPKGDYPLEVLEGLAKGYMLKNQWAAAFALLSGREGSSRQGVSAELIAEIGQGALTAGRWTVAAKLIAQLDNAGALTLAKSLAAGIVLSPTELRAIPYTIVHTAMEKQFQRRSGAAQPNLEGKAGTPPPPSCPSKMMDSTKSVPAAPSSSASRSSAVELQSPPAVIPPKVFEVGIRRIVTLHDGHLAGSRAWMDALKLFSRQITHIARRGEIISSSGQELDFSSAEQQSHVVAVRNALRILGRSLGESSKHTALTSFAMKQLGPEAVPETAVPSSTTLTKQPPSTKFSPRKNTAAPVAVRTSVEGGWERALQQLSTALTSPSKGESLPWPRQAAASLVLCDAVGKWNYALKLFAQLYNKSEVDVGTSFSSLLVSASNSMVTGSMWWAAIGLLSVAAMHQVSSPKMVTNLYRLFRRTGRWLEAARFYNLTEGADGGRSAKNRGLVLGTVIEGMYGNRRRNDGEIRPTAWLEALEACAPVASRKTDEASTTWRTEVAAAVCAFQPSNALSLYKWAVGDVSAEKKSETDEVPSRRRLSLAMLRSAALQATPQSFVELVKTIIAQTTSPSLRQDIVSNGFRLLLEVMSTGKSNPASEEVTEGISPTSNSTRTVVFQFHPPHVRDPSTAQLLDQLLSLAPVEWAILGDVHVAEATLITARKTPLLSVLHALFSRWPAGSMNRATPVEERGELILEREKLQTTVEVVRVILTAMVGSPGPLMKFCSKQPFTSPLLVEYLVWLATQNLINEGDIPGTLQGTILFKLLFDVPSQSVEELAQQLQVPPALFRLRSGPLKVVSGNELIRVKLPFVNRRDAMITSRVAYLQSLILHFDLASPFCIVRKPRNISCEALIGELRCALPEMDVTLPFFQEVWKRQPWSVISKVARDEEGLVVYYAVGLCLPQDLVVTARGVAVLTRHVPHRYKFELATPPDPEGGKEERKSVTPLASLADVIDEAIIQKYQLRLVEFAGQAGSGSSHRALVHYTLRLSRQQSLFSLMQELSLSTVDGPWKIEGGGGPDRNDDEPAATFTYEIEVVSKIQVVTQKQLRKGGSGDDTPSLKVPQSAAIGKWTVEVPSKFFEVYWTI